MIRVGEYQVRKTDRLFQLIELLRRHGVCTGAELARELEVSERTIYRDIAELKRSGVPVAGEAGVGYTLRRSGHLPPISFTQEEVAALALGSRLVEAWADGPAADAAESALRRIESALSPELRRQMAGAPVSVLHRRPGERAARRLSDFRRAIDERRYIALTYRDGDGSLTSRRVRPLLLCFWGWSWTLLAWCELRRDFREFRLDRVEDAELLAERFPREPGRERDDFLRWLAPLEEAAAPLPEVAAQGASK